MAKGPFFWRVIKQIILGSAIASKATAAVMPQPFVDDHQHVWQAIRREIEEDQRLRALPVPLAEAVAAAVAGKTDLSATIRLSYAMAAQRDFGALDAFWFSLDRVHGDATAVETLIEVRSTGAYHSGFDSVTKDDLLVLVQGRGGRGRGGGGGGSYDN